MSLKEAKLLKNKQSLYAIEESDLNFKIAKEILKPEIIVQSGIKELDKLIGGFKNGEITFVDGYSNLIPNIPNQICVNTYRMFHKDIIYIDGGICADPYKIAQYARKMEIDQKEVLGHIHISRAFTVYQLATLIQDMLEPVIKRYKPQTLIIGRFPILYLDSDIRSNEAQILLRSSLHKIRELTTKYGLITIFTNFDTRMLPNHRNARKIISQGVDEIILMKQNEMATAVELVNKQKNIMILHLSRGQLRLQDFGMVI